MQHRKRWTGFLSLPTMLVRKSSTLYSQLVEPLELWPEQPSSRSGLTPKLKEALEEAASWDSRSLAGMVEKILKDWAVERGFIKAPRLPKQTK